jgi:hypothetical protein
MITLNHVPKTGEIIEGFTVTGIEGKRVRGVEMDLAKDAPEMMKAILDNDALPLDQQNPHVWRPGCFFAKIGRVSKKSAK